LITLSVAASPIDGKTVSFYDIMKYMMDDSFDEAGPKSVGVEAAYFTSGKFLTFRNVRIVFDRAKDNDLDQRFATGGKQIVVTKAIHFIECDFPVLFWYLLRNVTFEEFVGFRECKNLKGIFKDCHFKHIVNFHNTNIGFLEFDNCKFDHGFKNDNSIISDHLSFKNCDFKLTKSLVVNPIYNTAMDVIKSMNPIPTLFLIINRNNPYDLSLENCTLKAEPEILKHPESSFNISESFFNNLRLINTTSNIPVDISHCSVENQFTLYDCTLENNVLAEALSFDTNNAKVDWSSLSGNKLCIRIPNTQQLVNGNSTNELKKEFYFNTLISTYALFYTTYKQQGNRLSANACYREWKDIETIYLKHLLDETYNFNTYFSWLMNVFLKTFCDYGTNPIKSIQWSFYVMLSFGLFYFWFPTKINSGQSVWEQLHLYGEYYTSRKRLSHINLNPIAQTNDSSFQYAEFKRYLSDNKTKLPLYYRIFGRQIFVYSKLIESIKLFYHKILDRLTGQWDDLSRSRKVIGYIIFTFLIVTVVSYYFLKRLLDAMATSLNAFSTLGFGDIPVQGAAKYFAIIEGFVGWFLLSIFSVALISQIIQ
jgi:hypothetical protein